MNVLVIGDPHFKVSNAYESDIMHSKIIEAINEHSIDFTVVLGDVLDKFESINVRPLNRAEEFLEDVRRLSPHTYVLIGNHDRPNNNVYLTHEHPFNGIKKWEKFTIVDKVVVEEIMASTGETASFVFVPYVPNGRLREALTTVELDHPMLNPDCNQEWWSSLKTKAAVFAHQEFKGCKMGAIPSLNGDVWHPDAPMCISGHIHDYQILHPNMYYPGTPIQHGFSDTGKKSISLYTFEIDDSKEWKMVNELRIDLKVPKKIHIRVTAEELISFEVPENAMSVKLDISVDNVEYKQLLKNSNVKKLIEAGVKLKPIDTRSRIKRDEYDRSTVCMAYVERLHNAIRKEDEDVRELFENMFGELIEEALPKAKPKKVIKISPKRKKQEKKKIILKPRRKVSSGSLSDS